MRVSRRTIVMGSVGIAAVAGVGWLMRPKSVPVDIAYATREPMRVTVDAEGRTEVEDRYAVAAPVTGRLRRIELHEGDMVAAGTIVAWIAPAPLDGPSRRQAEARLTAAQALLHEAEVRVAQARVAEADAKRVAERREVVFRAGGISREELDQMTLAHRARADDLAAADARRGAAESEVAGARAVLAGGESAIAVRAPVRGRVLRIPEPSERVVMSGTPILELGDARALQVIADVLSSDAVKLRVGDAAEVVDWGGEDALHARVRSIEPSAFTRVSALGVDEQRVNVRLDLLDSPPTLGDGFRVEVRVTVWERPEVLTVPASAAFRRGEDWAVFVIEDGRARERLVRLGHRTAATVEVLRGLEPGARVILFPSDQIADATRVRPTGA
ncbi:MAG TPA: efflux RND transporter periplasmic adaptor subunit [Gemmatimonadaceae bacterium]|nr:efflux RND transporter periplasmic adaptor subunit [Gemmatimonadaceae bacterium]